MPPPNRPQRKNGWTHPVHARGVRSPRFDLRGGKLLDDDTIDDYRRKGYYGAKEQKLALLEQKVRQRPKKKKKVKKVQLTVADALEALLG